MLQHYPDTSSAIVRIEVEPNNYSDGPLKTVLSVFEKAFDQSFLFNNNKQSILSYLLNEFGTKDNKIGNYVQVVEDMEINLVGILQKGKFNGYLDSHIDVEATVKFMLASYFGTRNLMAHNENAAKISIHRSNQLIPLFVDVA